MRDYMKKNMRENKNGLKQSKRDNLPVICPCGFWGGCQLRVTDKGSPSTGTGVRSLGMDPGAVDERINGWNCDCCFELLFILLKEKWSLFFIYI